MRLLGPDDGCKQVDIDGRRFHRQKDGTFHLPSGDAARQLKSTGDFTEARTRVAGRGFRCAACAFLSVFRDRCGRCGSTTLSEEN